VYERLPTYLLPSPRSLACRLQFLADSGRLPYLVPSRVDALRRWRRREQDAAGAAADERAARRRAQLARLSGEERLEQPLPTWPNDQAQAAIVLQAGSRRPRWDAPGQAPPFLSLSHAVKSSRDTFCRYAGLARSELEAFDAAFDAHPAWRDMQARGKAVAAEMRRVLDELEAAAEAEAEEGWEAAAEAEAEEGRQARGGGGRAQLAGGGSQVD
jgi:hypothetical protein